MLRYTKFMLVPFEVLIKIKKYHFDTFAWDPLFSQNPKMAKIKKIGENRGKVSEQILLG